GIRDFHVTGVQTCALPILIFTAGFVLLYLAYLAWDGAFKAHSNRGMFLRFGAAFLLLAAWLVIPMGWERMLVSGDKDFLGSLPKSGREWGRERGVLQYRAG